MGAWRVGECTRFAVHSVKFVVECTGECTRVLGSYKPLYTWNGWGFVVESC
jgi:hypothetical protein